MSIHLKLNLGGQGAAPSVPADWTNVWGLPYVDADLTADVDFGNINGGIGLRCINNGSPDAWGENNNTAAHDLGKETGDNSGFYPDAVLKHGWFTNARTGKIELYNHTGTPLSGKTFTVRMLGSRKDLTVPRTSLYSVNGDTRTLDVDDNVNNFVEFNGVTLVNGVITITLTNTTPSDTTFAYLGAIELEEEVEHIHLKLNLGGWGSAPTPPPGWTNVWGVPYVDADLSADVDFSDVGKGIGLRCINNGDPNCWGENNNTAAHDLGKVTGTNSGIYPDDVLKHGWFTNNRTGKIELYNSVGTPLNGKTFTIRMLGSRKDLTQPRTSVYQIGATSISQDVDDNINRVAVFSGVAPVSGVITITVTNGAPSDATFAYVGAIEVEEEEETTVRDITSVTNPSAKSVPYGTAFQDLGLPTQVTVTLDDSTTRQINVQWAQGSYNPQSAGAYSITGTLINLPAGITNSANRTASISVTVEAQTGNINLKLNLGGQGTAPSVAGWTNVWGQPYVDANLTTDVDKGNVGYGIGLRCINDDAPNAWGENLNTAVHNLGKSTGDNSGRYPDAVLVHGWFTNARTGKIQLYNHTGTPLSGKSFTIRLLGSRKDLTVPRTSQYTVNGVSKTLDVDDNVSNVAEFTHVTAVNNVITITVTNTTPSDTTFAYLNAIEIVQEGSAGPSPAKLYFDTYSSSKNVLVYLPPGFDNAKPNPVIFYYSGEGGKGAPAVVSNQVVGTGNDVDSQFGGTFNTPGYYRVLYSSVVVKVAGSAVAYGKANGKIEGDGISGTMEHQKQNGGFNITFDTPPATGESITITYTKSQIFETGLTEFLNRGDQPPGVVILCPQLPLGGSDYSSTGEFDDLLTFADGENFNIDTNRVYLTGLSRGGRGCRIILLERSSEIAAVIANATPDYGGFNWANNSNIGTMWIMGTSDQWGNESFNILSAAGALALNIYPRTMNLWGVGHSGWNTECYNRKERTDATGTASFDYVRWLKKHSINLDQRATLFVEYAEFTKLIEDHREALKQVNLMTAGSAKTALQTRLTKLKTSIDAGGKRYLLDLGLAANTTSGYNNITNLATGQSISNMVDDAGGASSYGFTVVTQSVASGQQLAISSNRGNATYFGFERNTNYDGCTLSTTAGVYKFTGLNPAKTYKLRFHHNEGSSNFDVKAEISVKIGTTTKVQYSAGNTMKYIEFTGITPSGAGEIQFEAKSTASRNTYLTAIELYQSA